MVKGCISPICPVAKFSLRTWFIIQESFTTATRYFSQKTKRNAFYSLQGQRVAGFNSLFAVSSIPMAMAYYREIRKQLASLHREMTVATIFSFNPNEADPEDALTGESFDTASLDATSRDFLDQAIADYNTAFNTNFDTSADKFQNYYKDLSLRMKTREIDLLVVVNMFLTGFDATTLNTLWVDKNLRHHSLIQAYSRTNRILNSVKTFGNIVCFRDLQKETDEAIALFGDKDAGGVVLLKTYEDYYNGFDEENADGSVTHTEGYRELTATLLSLFPLGVRITGEQNEKDFIALFGHMLRLRNILAAFDAFRGNEILSERQMQDYQSVYLDLYQKHRQGGVEKEDITSDIVFEMELVRQVDITIDYILMLVEKYRASHGKDKTILASISAAVNASIELRSKKELIEGFIESVNASSSIASDWKRYVRERKEADLSALIERERLKPDETRKFLERAFQNGELKTIGEGIQKIMPPSNPFDRKSGEKKKGIVARIKEFFEKYLGLMTA